MANRSYLLAVEDRSTTWSDDPEHEIVAEGINEIPVFWAALFAPGDRQVDTYEVEDEDGNDRTESIPNWCVEAETARKRLASLREPIGGLLDERSREVWHRFVDHLSGIESRYFKTNGAEVWDLDPDGYDAYWGKLLRLFAEPTPENLKAAVAANDLDLTDGAVGWEYEEETTCKLAGAEHIRDVPWFP